MASAWDLDVACVGPAWVFTLDLYMGFSFRLVSKKDPVVAKPLLGTPLLHGFCLGSRNFIVVLQGNKVCYMDSGICMNNAPNSGTSWQASAMVTTVDRPLHDLQIVYARLHWPKHCC
jgi:hypothetical protein